jgi:hypothetical protein
MANVKEIWAHFHTIDDDKDRDDGISETYMLDGRQIAAKNQSWGKGLVFRDDSWDLGQRFDVSGLGLRLNEINRLQYQFDMDNDDGWNVEIHIRVRTDDGNEYEVARQLCNIGDGNSRSGSVNLRHR